MSNTINNFGSEILRDERLRYALATASAGLAIWTVIDRRRWKSLDTGGTPPTWYGYSRMTLLRIARLFKGGDLSSHYPLRRDGQKILRDTIEPRQGSRPKMREWTLPQRQEVLPIDPEVHARIFTWTEKFAKENPDFLELRLSKTEGFSAPAVYAKADLATRNPEAKDWVMEEEIFHAHPEDSSLHVWLSEADLKEVVSRGWGERFPLSALGMMTTGYGFIYTPRTMAECDTVEEIIRAGIEYVTGRKPA